MSRLLPYDSPKDAEVEPESESSAAQDKVDIGILDDDNNIRKTIVNRENQVSELRTKAYEHAVTVCFAFAVYLAAMVFLFAFGVLHSISDQAQLAIFATPILSIAAITVFILRGVFGTPSAQSFSEEIKQVSSISNGISNGPP